MSAQAVCDDCGWRGTVTSRAMAESRARIHTCTRTLAEAGAADRIAARAAALAARPEAPCHHAKKHVHGTRACYVVDRCRCPRCTKAVREAQAHRDRLIAYGRWEALVDAAPAREHVRALAAAGIGWRRVVELSGLSNGALGRLIYGRDGRAPSRRIRVTTRDAILAVPLTALADHAVVDGTATRRRLQALCLLGWSPPALAREVGRDVQAVRRILDGHATTHEAARAAAAGFPRLLDAPAPTGGSATRARNMAAAAGWLPASAWDDIDDVEERPDAPAEVDAMAALAEDVEWLLAAGGNWYSVPGRLGRSRAALERTLQRSRRHDLVAALTAATHGTAAA